LDEPTFTAEEIEEGRVLAAVGYLGILFVLPLALMPRNRFCKAHAKQALVLFITASLASMLSCFGTFFGGGMLALLAFILSVVGLINAAQGKLWKIPGVWDIAHKINI